MSDCSYLFSLRLCHALRDVFTEGYNANKLSKDLLAGITVGIIAIPLALAIASGVAPQYGLYTAIIAGFIIALTGGSRYSISGPTAAFVVTSLPRCLAVLPPPLHWRVRQQTTKLAPNRQLPPWYMRWYCCWHWCCWQRCCL